MTIACSLSCENEHKVAFACLSCNPGQAVLLLSKHLAVRKLLLCFPPGGLAWRKTEYDRNCLCVCICDGHHALRPASLLFVEKRHAPNSCCSAFHSSIVQGTQAGANPKVFTGTASILLEANKRLFLSFICGCNGSIPHL